MEESVASKKHSGVVKKLHYRKKQVAMFSEQQTHFYNLTLNMDGNGKNYRFRKKIKRNI